MILTCERCQTQYSVSDDKIGENGRKVRCVNCRHVWFQTLEGALPYEEPEEEALPSPAAEAEAPEASAVPEKSEPVAASSQNTMPAPHTGAVIEPGARAFGGYVFALLCLVTVLALVLGRVPLVDAYPKALVLYQPLGLQVEPPGKGFALHDVRADYKGTVLVLNGTLSNITDTPLPAPKIRVRAQDKDGDSLYEHVMTGEGAMMEAGATRAITLKLENVSPEAETLAIAAERH